MSTVSIRPEQAGEEDAIDAVIAAAFADAPHSDGSEPAIVRRLRATGDLTLSLTASRADAMIGHIAFSPVTIADGSPGWFGMGPVSVSPEWQRLGIGGGLIERGVALLRERGAGGIVVLGDPPYYGKFGFRHDPALVFPGPPAEYFQQLALGDARPRGRVSYAPAFG